MCEMSVTFFSLFFSVGQSNRRRTIQCSLILNFIICWLNFMHRYIIIVIFEKFAHWTPVLKKFIFSYELNHHHITESSIRPVYSVIRIALDTCVDISIDSYQSIYLSLSHTLTPFPLFSCMSSQLRYIIYAYPSHIAVKWKPMLSLGYVMLHKQSSFSCSLWANIE